MEITVSNASPESMTLTSALLFYEGTTVEKNHVGKQRYSLATYHNVTHENGKAQIKEGILADLKTLKKVFAKIKPSGNQFFEKKEMLPEGTIYKDEDKIIWVRKEKTTPIFFATQEEKDINGKIIKWPNLIFVLRNDNSLYVHVCKSLKNINPQTKYLSTPFFNISENGDVCMTPNNSPGNLMEKVETHTNGIYEIPFTHPNAGNRKTKCWLEHMRTAPLHFPYDKMDELGTVNNLINGY